MSPSLTRRALGALALLPLLVLGTVTPVFAHEHRHVAGYELTVGFIDEPVYTGQKSGLELQVTHDEQPVTDVQDTLQAQVIYGDSTRDLTLSPRFGEDGWYQSVFFPTAAGPYTFRIFGTINGQAVDESFTSSPDGFSEVQEQTAGQFPNSLPATVDLAAQAERGAAAADQVMIAMALAAIGIVVGLLALAAVLATRRRPA